MASLVTKVNPRVNQNFVRKKMCALFQGYKIIRFTKKPGFDCSFS